VMYSYSYSYGYELLVFNTTFNNNSIISSWSVLLGEETREQHKSLEKLIT